MTPRFSSLHPSRLLPAIAVCIVVLVSSAYAPAASMTAAFQWSQGYQEDVWQPVWMELRNESDHAINGSVALAISDAKRPSAMRVPVSVPANAIVGVTVWGYFPPRDLTSTRKDGNVPPVAEAKWLSVDGASLARAPLVGYSRSDTAGGDSGSKQMVLVIGKQWTEKGDAFDVQELVSHLNALGTTRLTMATVEPDGVIAHGPALRPLKAVVLDTLDPESLNLNARRTLLNYVSGGGTLIVPAPLAVPQGSWLASLLPVKLVGRRQVKEIEVDVGGGALKLSNAAEIVEAVDTGGEVLLRSAVYVHVAQKRVGLGKVVFTSFPINALANSQPRVGMLWESLLELKSPTREVAASQLREVRQVVLGSMVGRKVASWGLAAALAGGYLLAIVAVQGLFAGRSRPKAAVISLAAAILLSTTLVGMSFARRGSGSLQSARLSVVDVTSEGGTRQETLALIGVDDDALKIESADDFVSIRPALADLAMPPIIRQPPFAVEKAGVFSERIERVWEATGDANAALKLSAFARFDVGGITLDVSNGLGKTLESPLLISQRRAMSMEDVPVGLTTIRSLRLNPRNDFTPGRVVTSNQSKRRGQVIAASIIPLGDDSVMKPLEKLPMLVGWIDEESSAALMKPKRDVTEATSMTLVRTPLQIEPAKVGAKVAIPAALMQMDTGRLPYDAAKGETVPSQETSQWLVRFFPPPQIGQMRTSRATLEVRVALPAHTMTVMKGQAPGGKPQVNRNGEIVAEWSKDVGMKTVPIEVGPNDCDSDGGVWILLGVSPAGSGGASGGAPASWQIKELGVSIEGEIVAPPKPIDLDPPPRPFTVEN